MKKFELRPCPFCGSRPVLQTDTRYPRPECEPRKAYEVVCKNWDCVIYMADARYKLNRQEAIDAWNRRASDYENP